MKTGINGHIVNKEEAVVSVYDHGFLYGMGLFETFRSYEGRFLFLDRHLDRLRESLEEWRIDFPISNQQVEEHLHELLSVNQLKDAYFRLSVSAGMGEVGLPTKPYQNANWVVYIKELPIFPGEWFIHGRDIYTLSIPRNRPETPIRKKSFHFANNIFAKWELGDRIGEGIFLTQEGYLAEGMVSNLFFVKDHKLYTPSLDTGILPGITREKVLDLAQKEGVAVEEGTYDLPMLRTAKEAFLTNSIMEIVPACRIDENPIGDGKVGPVTKQLIAAYHRLIIEKEAKE
jgi:4-amino-4-deoxychorismate lyase